MGAEELYEMRKKLTAHLKERGESEVAPERRLEFERTLEAVRDYMPSAQIEVRDDPLQLGALIVKIEGYGFEVNGLEGVRIFSRLVETAGNFEIYPVDADRIGLAIVLQ